MQIPRYEKPHMDWIEEVLGEDLAGDFLERDFEKDRAFDQALADMRESIED